MKFTTDKQREHPYANVLLMGRPKAGKTTGACSAPGMIGYLNCGEPNAVELGHELYGGGGRIQEVDMSGSTKGLLSEVMQSCYPAQGRPVIDTWVLDPVGDLHRRLLKELSGGAVRPHRDTYGDVAVLVEDFCRFMCEAPCNFVMVAHDWSAKPSEEPAHPFTGTSNPAVGHKIMQMVDLIAYVGLVLDDQGRFQPMAQIVPTDERPVGVRGRFNRLLTPEVMADGVVPLNLTEWLRIAEKWLGEPEPVEQAEAA
jgi:hypothetical protein